MIQWTVAEQTIEIVWVICLVAREILALFILKIFVMFHMYTSIYKLCSKNPTRAGYFHRSARKSLLLLYISSTLFFHTYLLGLPYKHLCEVKSMFRHDMESHTLVDDTGIHEDTKVKKITFFVGLCRLVTVILIVLGVLNLIYGNI